MTGSAQYSQFTPALVESLAAFLAGLESYRCLLSLRTTGDLSTRSYSDLRVEDALGGDSLLLHERGGEGGDDRLFAGKGGGGTLSLRIILS